MAADGIVAGLILYASTEHDCGAAYYENMRQERELHALHREAAAKGMKLVQLREPD
jgi:hypothetical protein